MPTGTGSFQISERIFPSRNASDVAHERNADQHDFRAGLVALGDFVRDARERALDGGGVEDDGGFRHKKIANHSAGRSRFALCVWRS